MSKRIRDNFNPRFKAPIDNRFNKENVDVDTPYQGMFKFQPSDKEFYKYIDGQYVPFLKDVRDSINDINNDLKNYIKNGGYVTPEEFGAIGNGIADDTLAVQAALDTKKPVIFMHDYGVKTINIGYNQSKFVDFNGFFLHALDDGYVLDINTMYATFHNIAIDGNLRPNGSGCIFIHSEAVGVGYQSQFLTFRDVYIRNAVLGIQYGDGTTNAQSENNIDRLKMRSVLKGININQPNGFLHITNSEIDNTPYEWTTIPTGVTRHLINQTVGGFYITNSTIECPSGSSRGIIGGNFNIDNCVIEIPNENFEFVGNDNNNGVCNISNTSFYKSQNTPIFTCSSITVNVNLSNISVYGANSLVHYSTGNIIFSFDGCRFDSDIGGVGAKIVKCVNTTFNGANLTPNTLSTSQFSDTGFKKASKEILVSIDFTSSGGSLVMSTAKDSTITESLVIASTVTGSKTYSLHIKPVYDFDKVQFGATSGTITEIRLYTCDDGKRGYSSATKPTQNYYPIGSIIANTGDTTTIKGWLYNGTTMIDLH